MPLRELELWLPGLLGPWADARQPGFPIPEAPALAYLLSRAERYASPLATENALAARFGLPGDATPPVAALTRYLDCGSAPGHWLRADPVHLHPDLRQVLMLGNHHLALSKAEADALVASINQTFADEPWHLEAPEPLRWYLLSEIPPDLVTEPLARTLGRDINPLLPRGGDSRYWISRLTEIQMLLHDHPVNLAREAEGRATVNSIWLWGEGRLPDAITPPSMGLWGNNPLLLALAACSGLDCAPAPDNFTTWQGLVGDQVAGLVYLDDLRYQTLDQDPIRWQQRVAALEQHWLAPLTQALSRGELDVVTLEAGNGWRYRFSRQRRWWFWRRTRPLVDHLVA